jgi:hypothetical protein
MDVIHPRYVGIDCSKKDAKVCVRIHGQGWRAKSATVTTWGATTGQILALREHLVAAKVTCVVIESTSDYWKPFYYLLDDELDVMLVNASQVRNLPARKTDLLTELPRGFRGGCVPGGVRLARFAARDRRWRSAAGFGGARARWRPGSSCPDCRSPSGGVGRRQHAGPAAVRGNFFLRYAAAEFGCPDIGLRIAAART